MAVNTVAVTLQIRNSIAENWTTRNPVLAQGEYGLESDTFLLKVGDGIRDWQHLPYLNKFDADYFAKTVNGDITLAPDFVADINNLIAQAGGSAKIVITNDPVEPTDPVNLRYLEWAIAHSGHLTREIVTELPTIADADSNTMYLIASQSGVGYDEYMVINGVWDMVGATSDSQSGYTLPVATVNNLGGVRADDPLISGHENTEYLSVTQEGFMTLNKVSTSKLFVPTGDTLIIYGGTA